jgi:integrase
MTIEKAVDNLKAIIGEAWPKMNPLPTEPVITLCEALWASGLRPNVTKIASYFPGSCIRPFIAGVAAWRQLRGFTNKARYPALGRLEDLTPHIAPEIAAAPLTCFDPTNDGRWPIPSPKVIGYVRGIENVSIRNAMALYAGLNDVRQHQYYSRIVTFVTSLRPLMRELNIEDVTRIDPDDLFRRLLVKDVGVNLTDGQRVIFPQTWNMVRNSFDDYAEKLFPTQREVMTHFFIRRVVNRRGYAKHGVYTVWKHQQQARVKAKTSAVHNRFHQLRHIARLRLNQSRRMYEATRQAIEHVELNQLPLPHDFGYEETATLDGGRTLRQRVHMTLWDTVSRWDRMIELGYHSIEKTRLRRRRGGEFSPERRAYQVEYRRTDPIGSKVTPSDPWFLELIDNYAVSPTWNVDRLRQRIEFYRRWGYNSSDHWYLPTRIVGWGPHLREWDWLRERGHRLFSSEGVFVAALFGHFAIRIQTITGARLGEVQQIAQNPECIKQLVNVGPKAATRWLLRLIPKGEGIERRDYYVDEDTKNDLLEVIGFLRAKTRSKMLPVVRPQFHKTPPDRYVFQWDRRALDQCALNGMIRFLLHGAAIRAADGQAVHLTSHVLRHAFATEMAGLKVPVDIIAEILHQRDTTVTKYYSRPTETQVIEAAEMIFVDRVDVAQEALRSPTEISRMLKEAEGKIGALTEVLGGTCVVANFCPAKFACIGCAGNAPDPDKRYQIEHKLAWAREQAAWAAKENLLAEARQMKHLVQDCELMVEEMDLIECARRDAAQSVVVEHHEGVAK